MGRIKGRKPEETREAVLQAATDAFAEYGFANATLGTIATNAGVTAATLPYHFGDKQGLYDAVIDGIYQDMIAYGEQFDREASFPEVMAQVYLWSCDRRNSVRVLIRSVIESGSLDRQHRETRVAPAIKIIATMASQRWGIPFERCREAIVALTHLTTRFVTNSMADNMAVFGVATEEECHARIVSMLQRVGCFLLGIPAPEEL